MSLKSRSGRLLLDIMRCQDRQHRCVRRSRSRTTPRSAMATRCRRTCATALIGPIMALNGLLADRLVGRRDLRGHAHGRVPGRTAPQAQPIDAAAPAAQMPPTAETRERHASHHRGLRSHRRGECLRRAGARQCADRAGPRRHQSRHRPARLPHARFHRRGGGEGAARRPSRLYARDRHPAAARGGGGRPAQALRRDRVARRGDDPARRQADHVHGDHDVRRARRRHPLSRPRLPDLPLDDRVHRRQSGPGADPRGERLCVLRRGDAQADHAEDAAPDRQLAGQSDRRRHAQERDRQARRRAREMAGRLRAVGRDLRPHGL